MLSSAALIAAITVACIGTLLLWANPHRRVNQAVFTCSLHGALWLWLRYTATTSDTGLFWLRWTTATGALVPLHLWFVKECIAAESGDGFVHFLRRSWVWLTVSVVIATICFTEFFIPSYSTDERRVFGLGYYIYIFGLVGLYAALCRDTYVRMNSLMGVRRLEMQIWLLGGSATAGSVIAFMAIRAFWGLPDVLRLQPFVILAFYGVTAYAITTNRVFNARHLLIIGAQKAFLVILVAGVAAGAGILLRMYLPDGTAFVLMIALSLWLAAELNSRLNRALRFYPQAAEARSRALEIAMRELRPEPLREAFGRVLKGWSQSERVVVLACTEKTYCGEDIEFSVESPAMTLLREIRWATPERLIREKRTAARDELRKFLDEQQLGAIVLSETSHLGLICGVGTRATRRPFTYPEIQQLLELSSIFQTAMARSLLWSKVQRAEQLATVGLLGASVAHEIRNPLVTIKAFVQLLPQHYNDATFRERFSRLIGSEVSRIDRLTEQLLDLATPHSYHATPQPLHAVLLTSLELVKAKAGEGNTQLITALEANPDWVLIDPNAAKQVVLNLCFNAIQAQENQPGDRWVRIATRKVDRGVEMTVADNGPGISAEVRPRLFEAFQSTKSSGFGLGLAVCSEILTSLGATIAVDPYTPGNGAVFRVVFSCPPPTS